MNEYVIKSFIDRCDELMLEIAEEKLETNILDGTLAKQMVLYHGSKRGNLKTIAPNSWNVGTRISKTRKSSFWTNNFDYAVVWALDWIAIEAGMCKYCFHDPHQKVMVVLDGGYCIEEIRETPLVKKYPDLIKAKMSKAEDGKNIINIRDILLTILKTAPVYVYKATVPMKYIGKGQVNIDEYTVDKQVTPEECIQITPEMADKYIKSTDRKTFEKYYDSGYGNSWYKKANMREKLLYKSGKTVFAKRRKLYDKDRQKEDALKKALGDGN